jgi:hypothetical protein
MVVLLGVAQIVHNILTELAFQLIITHSKDEYQISEALRKERFY